MRKVLLKCSSKEREAMAKALFNGTVVAESNDCIIYESNYYFPPESVDKNYLQKSDHHTFCPHKGEASYYHIQVGDETCRNGAWYYPEPKAQVDHLKGYLAFWNGVKVEA